MKTSSVPQHVAIIMDGNGRWAELRRRERTFGHIKGARVAKTMIETCAELGVEQLTLYTFSTENWSRPVTEVSFLLKLLGRHLTKERKNLVKNNIRFSVIGDTNRLPTPVQAEIRKTIDATRACTGMSLTFALSYGSRQEMTWAMQSIAEDVRAGRLQPDDVNEKLISSRMQSSFMKDPDLIIRTSGEFRLSNFLLWQAAYSEIYVCDTLWPDFDKSALQLAFQHYARRERRFGRTTAQTASPLADVVEITSARHASIR